MIYFFFHSGGVSRDPPRKLESVCGFRMIPRLRRDCGGIVWRGDDKSFTPVWTPVEKGEGSRWDTLNIFSFSDMWVD